MTIASCHDMKVFAEYMRTRFLNTGKKSAAVTAVSQFAKDAPLSEAVLLAIESLTTRESKELRRVVDQFHDYCEWRDIWASGGWTAVRTKEHVVYITSPPIMRGRPPPGWPSPRIVAAAVGASAVEEVSDPWNEEDPNSSVKRLRVKYRIT